MHFQQYAADGTPLILHPRGQKVYINKRSLVPLKGAELEQFEALRRLEKAKEAARKHAIEQAAALRAMNADIIEGGGETGKMVGQDALDALTKKLEKAKGKDSGDDGEDVSLMDIDGDEEDFGFFSLPRFPMYAMPKQFHAKPAIDEYGEVVDTSRYEVEYASGSLALAKEKERKKLRSSQTLFGQQFQTNRRNMDAESDFQSRSSVRQRLSAEALQEEDDKDDERVKAQLSDEGIPVKGVVTITEIEVHCGLAYIDLEGLSDGQSIKRIISKIKPRATILINGSRTSKDEVGQFLQEKGGCDYVFSPQFGQEVALSSNTNIYQVQLKDTLSASLKFKEIGGYMIAPLFGQITMQNAGDKDETATGSDISALPDRKSVV